MKAWRPRQAEVITFRFPRASRQTDGRLPVCVWCGGEIRRAELYRKERFLFSGETRTNHWHLRCHAVSRPGEFERWSGVDPGQRKEETVLLLVRPSGVVASSRVLRRSEDPEAVAESLRRRMWKAGKGGYTVITERWPVIVWRSGE